MANFSFDLINMQMFHFDLINFLKILRSWPQNKFHLSSKIPQPPESAKDFLWFDYMARLFYLPLWFNVSCFCCVWQVRGRRRRRRMQWSWPGAWRGWSRTRTRGPPSGACRPTAGPTPTPGNSSAREPSTGQCNVSGSVLLRSFLNSNQNIEGIGLNEEHVSLPSNVAKFCDKFGRSAWPVGDFWSTEHEE